MYIYKIWMSSEYLKNATSMLSLNLTLGSFFTWLPSIIAHEYNEYQFLLISCMSLGLPLALLLALALVFVVTLSSWEAKKEENASN